MAEAISKSIKELLSLKIKPRQDGYSDQFCRIIMCKFMLIGALVTGMNWYNDKITCIISKFGDKDPVMDSGFVSSACWINGLYIYKEIRYHPNKLGYYGIPNDISFDGMLANGKVLCSTSKHPEICKPMEKTFFLQYQYMTFLLLALGMLYYSPYYLFTIVNTDMVSLKASIKGESTETILSNYFDTRVNPVYQRRLRVIGTIVVKLLYITSSVIAFIIVDGVLHTEYRSYGANWLRWSKLNNTIAYDYLGRRSYPKPGDALLPSYGFCEVYEAAQDVKVVLTNKHKFVCEMSQHILYQYIFIILWFAMVITIVVSLVGFLALVVDHLLTVLAFGQNSRTRNMKEHISLREFQYLELIRRKNMTVYGGVLRMLEERLTSGVLPDDKPKMN